MRQVPQYLLIGSGRVAQHFQYYFSTQKLSFKIWNRSDPLEQLYKHLEQTTHVLLLISDNAIDEFVTQHLTATTACLIHFSGSLISKHAFGAHPLMSFNKNNYSIDQYQSIPFVIDHDAPEFEDLLPGLPNKNFRLHKNLKAKYHALCVLSGNFSCLLWQKFFHSLENDFNLPPSIANAYLFQHTQNLISDPKSALTGPLARNDMNTIKNNLLALDTDPFKEIYKSFVSCYQQLNESKKL